MDAIDRSVGTTCFLVLRIIPISTANRRRIEQNENTLFSRKIIFFRSSVVGAARKRTADGFLLYSRCRCRCRRRRSGRRAGMRFCRASKVSKRAMFARLSAADGIRVDAKRNPRGRGMHSIMRDTRITRRRYSSRVSATKSVSIDRGYCENYRSLPPLLPPLGQTHCPTVAISRLGRSCYASARRTINAAYNLV